MFEVRGLRRPARGRMLAAVVADDAVILRYEGLDGLPLSSVDRLRPGAEPTSRRLRPSSRSRCPPTAGPTSSSRSGWAPRNRPRARASAPPPPARATPRVRSRRRGATVSTSGRVFNEWLGKSRADLALLTTELPTGPYPYAGIPWFSTAFGRDAIVTALQMLWLDPALARGVLRFLAAHQATETSRFPDAAPGKIMHETRKGEMARLSELPFGRYYGGVDTTPLFVVLAGAYAERTGDLALIDELWPSLQAAMAWIEGDGDSNRDGFLDYARGADTGLANQGWKDSEDSVFHADGRDAAGPVALVEVQGYVYAAFLAMADLAARRGEADDGRAAGRAKAERLRAAVEERFWVEELGTYALALDGAGRPCRVRASNPGTCCSPGCPRRTGPSGSRPSSSAPASTPAGASARSPAARPATTRCPTTTARSGRTTPRSAPPAWPATARATAWRRC